MSTYRTDLRTWLAAQITAANIIKEDDSNAPGLVTFSEPANVIIKDYFQDKKRDLYWVITVRTGYVEPTRHTQHVPGEWHNRYDLRVYAVDRLNQDEEILAYGSKVRDLVVDELERIFDANPTSLAPYRRHYIAPGGEENDREIQGIKLFETSIVVRYEISRP